MNWLLLSAGVIAGFGLRRLFRERPLDESNPHDRAARRDQAWYAAQLGRDLPQIPGVPQRIESDERE